MKTQATPEPWFGRHPKMARVVGKLAGHTGALTGLLCTVALILGIVFFTHDVVAKLTGDASAASNQAQKAPVEKPHRPGT